jgi:hypothetical protein
LDGKVINGTLRLLKEVSNDSIQVVDSGDERVTGIDFHKSKVLLPMLIGGNHWVLGVYEDSAGLLVYDSLPTSTTRTAVVGRARRIFGKDDGDNLDITITSPFLQTNDDCGVFSIIAAFHETMGFTIKPTEIDPDFWRDILLRLLSPQPYVEQVPVETRIDLSGLPPNPRSSEIPTIVSQFFQTISASLHKHSNAKKKKLASAELVLKIIRHAKESATKANLRDAVTRFQCVEAYCQEAIKRLRQELELKCYIDSITRVCKRNDVKGEVLIEL